MRLTSREYQALVQQKASIKRKLSRSRKESVLEKMFEQQLKASDLSFEREFKFHPTRKWKFDFAMPEKKIAVEIEGGVWTNGRHTRAKGFIADCEKYNTATLMGWQVYRFTGQEVRSLSALNWVLEAVNARD
ncbi:DUF559 domain-containing protein [Basilea psittacipulmonis]|uniref:DUF559 domain-containing protein n=1 Tax=Basilea psittacipulmonis DSM 24701 TaxID=1072685 RepID=A0A077DHT8_9BURK|nr:DUF559 domain-containing protein [Basilea psittacipulmonis]AIL33107.1 hypothetical protein IX83_07135 [Basilea psittacipulmonis DSM 24701]